MKSRIISLILILSGVAIFTLIFQNCSNVDFTASTASSDSEVSSVDSSSIDIPTVLPGTTSPDDDNDGPTVIDLPTVNGDYASIAFEDNVIAPDAGDRDYNDMVFNFKVSETYNSLHQLEHVDIEIRIREKISGNNHRLFLYLSGNTQGDFSNITKVSQPAFLGLSDVTLTEPNGDVTVFESIDSILIVPKTKDAIGDIYKVSIQVLAPELNAVDTVPSFIDFRKYRFILQNHGQDMGIDISEINSTDEMLAADGYPLGFMIPTDWDPPREGQLIDNKYSDFSFYRNWLNGDQSMAPSQRALEWFLH